MPVAALERVAEFVERRAPGGEDLLERRERLADVDQQRLAALERQRRSRALDPSIAIRLGVEGGLFVPGRAFDGVILHTFFTDETTVRCVKMRTMRAGSAKKSTNCPSTRMSPRAKTFNCTDRYPSPMVRKIGRVMEKISDTGVRGAGHAGQ